MNAIIRHKKKCSSCGKETFLFGRGMCKFCYKCKPSPKRIEQLKLNKKYYALIISRFPDRRCQECDDEVKRPTGYNVSHIVSAGANIALYLDERNSFFLCRLHHNQWESGLSREEQRSSMKIYEEAMRRREVLTNEYYTTEKP